MKKLLFVFTLFNSALELTAQDVSVRVRQSNFSSVDPDGGGPATGTVTVRFELMSTVSLLADGIPFSMALQSSRLMATPTNTTVKLGPLATAGSAWAQTVDNRAGTAIAVPPTYGGQVFDRRMIISFSDPTGTPTVPVTTTWQPYAEITYWTLGATVPEGGFVTPEPGAIVAQNELSSDFGGSTYPYLSPDLNTPQALTLSIVPVTFSGLEVTCSGNTSAITWNTANETNTARFEVESSLNGNTNFSRIAIVAAAGQSTATRTYRYSDTKGFNAYYRIKVINLDGSFTYSDVKKSPCSLNEFVYAVYPVPAQDVLNIRISSGETTKAIFQLYDASGRIVRTSAANLVAGLNTVIMDVRSLPAGSYILRNTADAKLARTVLKQ